MHVETPQYTCFGLAFAFDLCIRSSSSPWPFRACLGGALGAFAGAACTQLDDPSPLQTLNPLRSLVRGFYPASRR